MKDICVLNSEARFTLSWDLTRIPAGTQFINLKDTTHRKTGFGTQLNIFDRDSCKNWKKSEEGLKSLAKMENYHLNSEGYVRVYPCT